MLPIAVVTISGLHPTHGLIQSPLWTQKGTAARQGSSAELMVLAGGSRQWEGKVAIHQPRCQLTTCLVLNGMLSDYDYVWLKD